MVSKLVPLSVNLRAEQEQWFDFVSLMPSVSLVDRYDKLGWLLDVSDSFAVSSARAFLNSGMLVAGEM